MQQRHRIIALALLPTFGLAAATADAEVARGRAYWRQQHAMTDRTIGIWPGPRVLIVLRTLDLPGSAYAGYRCRWLRARASVTGDHHWWEQYRDCRR